MAAESTHTDKTIIEFAGRLDQSMSGAANSAVRELGRVQSAGTKASLSLTSGFARAGAAAQAFAGKIQTSSLLIGGGLGIAAIYGASKAMEFLSGVARGGRRAHGENLVGGSDEFRESVHQAQEEVYNELDEWSLKHGLETSEEGWRAEAYLYGSEMKVPEWDGWCISICPSWIIAPKTKTWVELVPIEQERRFGFRVCREGTGFAKADEGTKQGGDVVCPAPLWEILKRSKKHAGTPREIPYNQLIENPGRLRMWEKGDFQPRADDILHERLFCIRWRQPDWIDDLGRKWKGMVYREPRTHDLSIEDKIVKMLKKEFDDWQSAGWIPSWRIEPGEKTEEPIRTRGWTYWHHLLTPRQLLMNGFYSKRISEHEPVVRAALTLSLGRLVEANSRLVRWKPKDGGGMGGTVATFYNQALNTFQNYAGRGSRYLKRQICPEHRGFPSTDSAKTVEESDARRVSENCHLWITDPPYADAVNYEELSEYFLAWYVPHLRAVFPKWYTDSMRAKAIKGDDAPFRVAMADCYKRLAANMPENGMQVLMFTHKSTDVWEDLALIMWAAGLQVKQVWSIATETAGAGIRVRNYVQSTYNMLLRKRTSTKMGFVDFITPQVNKRVKEVITRMRVSQIESGLTRCGYTDTDYLLAAQATAAEVVTGYASIDGVDLDAELRTPNAERGKSALRTLMENAKRTAIDFLVPPEMDHAIRKAVAGDPYSFWRQFCPEEKFLLKGLEGEAEGVFQDWGLPRSGPGVRIVGLRRLDGSNES